MSMGYTYVLAAHKLSGLVAHDLSGFDWVPKEVPNKTNRVVTGDPTDEVCARRESGNGSASG